MGTLHSVDIINHSSYTDASGQANTMFGPQVFMVSDTVIVYGGYTGSICGAYSPPYGIHTGAIYGSYAGSICRIDAVTISGSYTGPMYGSYTVAI